MTTPREAAILAAAGRALARDPRASMATIAREAGVGMSAVYRRWANKDALLLALNVERMRDYARVVVEAETRLASGDDPVEVFGWHLHEIISEREWVPTDPGAGQLPTPGTPAHDEWRELARRNAALFDQFAAAGALRAGTHPLDVALVLTAATSARGETLEHTVALRHRLLDVLVEGLRPGAPPLTAPAPTRAGYYEGPQRS